VPLDARYEMLMVIGANYTGHRSVLARRVSLARRISLARVFGEPTSSGTARSGFENCKEMSSSWTGQFAPADTAKAPALMGHSLPECNAMPRGHPETVRSFSRRMSIPRQFA